MPAKGHECARRYPPPSIPISPLNIPTKEGYWGGGGIRRHTPTRRHPIANETTQFPLHTNERKTPMTQRRRAHPTPPPSGGGAEGDPPWGRPPQLDRRVKKTRETRHGQIRALRCELTWSINCIRGSAWCGGRTGGVESGGGNESGGGEGRPPPRARRDGIVTATTPNDGAPAQQ